MYVMGGFQDVGRGRLNIQKVERVTERAGSQRRKGYFDSKNPGRKLTLSQDKLFFSGELLQKYEVGYGSYEGKVEVVHTGEDQFSLKSMSSCDAVIQGRGKVKDLRKSVVQNRLIESGSG